MSGLSSPRLVLAACALSLLGQPVHAQMADHAPGEMLVKFRSGIRAQSAVAAAGELRALGVTTVKTYGRTGVRHVRVPAGRSMEQALAALRADPNIEYAEPNYLLHADVVTPNDGDFSVLWGLHNIGQSGGTVDADIDGPEAWEVTTGGEVVVGVIDSGIDMAHPDLAANMWVNPGEIAGNGVDDDGNGYVDDVYGWDFINNDNDPFDDYGHGTHVAGTIGAVGDNGTGVTGVAWQVKLMALKFLDNEGDGFTSGAIEALEYATAMGAHLTNNSWGGGGYSQSLKDAIAAGHLFMASAGNDGENTEVIPHYPSGFDLANIVSVAATDRWDNLASFSNYGLVSVDLGAPGAAIWSTVPGVGYGYKSGTSMATPHVAGVAALVLAQNSALTPAQVKARLLDRADPVASLSGVTVTGARLNAASAAGPDILEFVQEPTDVTTNVSGQLISPQPTVKATIGGIIQDYDGEVELTLTTATAANGSLGGDTVINLVDGEGDFSGITFTASADGVEFELMVVDNGGGGYAGGTVSAPATSDVVATQLVFTTEPAGSRSGFALTTQPVVAAQDGDHVADTDFTEDVVLTLAAGAGTLYNATATASNGVATFANVTYAATADGEPFTLRANDQDGVDTDLPTVDAAALASDVLATQLVFVTQPSPLTVTSGLERDFTTDPVLEARDALGKADTDYVDAVTLAASGPGSATYASNSKAAVLGVAAFPDLRLTYAATADGEEFTLEADGGLLEGTSAALTADVVGTQLVFVTQPSPLTVTSGLEEDFTIDPVLEARDALGKVDTDYTDVVTLTASGPGEGTYGSNSKAAALGVAAFADLRVTYEATADGEEFTLEADGGLLEGTSAALTAEVMATQLVFSTQPSGAVNRNPLGIQPVVTAQDAAGRTDTDFEGTVTLTATATGGAIQGDLLGALSMAASAGVASFETARYDAHQDGDVFFLTAHDLDGVPPNLPTVDSDEITGLLGAIVIEIPLAAGYNLISMRLTPANDSIAVIAGPVEANLIQILGFETAVVNPNAPGAGGKLYNPALPTFTNTLKVTDDRLGYWLKMSAPDVLAITGWPIDSQTPVPLESGHNLVAYLPTFEDLPGHSAGTILPDLIQILGFETSGNYPSDRGPGGKHYNPGLLDFINSLRVMAPGLGYWVKMGAADTLVYPTEADPATPGGGASKGLASSSTDQHVCPTNQWMGIHGQLIAGGVPAEPGTVVEATDAAGNTAGWFAVHHAGAYGYMPIYLDDPDTEKDEGAASGEWLTLRVDGRATDYRVQWSEFGDLVQLDMDVDCVSSTQLPQAFALHQNYPNPFNPGTTIAYQLPRETDVLLAIYNMSGQMVRELVRAEVQSAGHYSITWDGQAHDGSPLASGIYLCRLRAGESEAVRKLLLAK